MIFTSK